MAMRRQLNQDMANRLLNQLLRGADRMNAFMHIGKTGGTSMFDLWGELRRAKQNSPLNLDHRWKLERANGLLPAGAKVHFVLRDPIERYISGFYSRQRKGLPDHERAWSEGEEIAFSNFSNVTELFRACISSDEAETAKAAQAFSAITHLPRGFAFHFTSVETIDRLKDRIGVVGRIERLDLFAHDLFKHLGVDDDVAKSLTPERRHAAPNPNAGHGLNDVELAALKEHLAEEYAVYNRLCDFTAT